MQHRFLSLLFTFVGLVVYSYLYICADKRQNNAFDLCNRLGYFYMRWSDDDGATWSNDREEVPYPNTWVDRQNNFKGKTHIMWTVDHIKVMEDKVGFGLFWYF